jgi:aldehyde:ferredoxin oxidoreductase
MSNGYMGKILRVDMTTRTTKEEPVTEELAKKYLGGVGFAFKYLTDELRPRISPLAPENKLIFAVGPLTATGAPCTSRMAVATKSPATGTIAVALSGGQFPATMKKAGFDMIIIEGKADKPTYIAIKNGEVSFKNADKFMGMLTMDTQLFIKDELKDQNYEVACIGPAGERLVPMASIIRPGLFQ